MFQIRNATEDIATIDILGKDIGESWFGDGYTMQNAKADLDAITAKEIIINISSLGGDINDALVIHDLLKMKAAKTTARIFGMTASSGTVLANGADTIEISENASFLIHNVWGVAVGNSSDLKKIADDFDLFDTIIKNIYKKRSEKSLDEISDLMAEEKWITPEKAKEFGLVDEVFTPAKADAKYNVKIDSKFINKKTTMKQPDDNVIDKLINGLKSLFDKDKDDNSDKVLNDLKTKTMTEIEKLTDAFKIDSDKLKADNTANETTIKDLKADLVKSKADLAKAEGKEVVVDPKNDPAPTPTPKSDFGGQLLDALSASQKRQLKNNTNK